MHLPVGARQKSTYNICIILFFKREFGEYHMLEIGILYSLCYFTNFYAIGILYFKQMTGHGVIGTCTTVYPGYDG